jgi:putative toxin-antitoxin system antitoxin component (TIGR02293 family)
MLKGANTMVLKFSDESVHHEPTRQSARSIGYLDIFRATPIERIGMIKAGILAAVAKRIIADLAIAQGEGFDALKLSQATVNRKAAQGKTLSPDESERVIGMAKLVGQLQAMIEESGNPEGFDAPAWLSRWLREPLPAFGGARPVDLMDTMEGQAMVANALAQSQSGAYA